jgi:uncharacterized membrane protein YbaN (DUF454 family)
MFVGHYSVSLAARRSPVDLPLWVWFVAVQWLDFVFMTLALLGIEKVRLTPGFTEANNLDLYYMPYSHGLVGSIVLSLAFAGIIAAVFPTARSTTGFAVVALASFSHWLLDLVVHTPDLPILNGEPKVGFGLWNHLAISLPLELVLLVLAAWFYTRGADRTVSLRAWVLVGVMVLLQLYSNFGTGPATPSQFALTALALYVSLTFGAYWVERAPKSAATTGPGAPAEGP